MLTFCSRKTSTDRHAQFPGEFIVYVYLDPNNFGGRESTQKLDVAPSNLRRILKCTSCVTPKMALRLSRAIGRSPESWLPMQ